MDIILILWVLSAFCGCYSYFVDIILIGHIKSYLACNFCHVIHSFVLFVDIIFIVNILHSFFLVVDIICIGHIKSYLACNVRPIFHSYSYSVSDCAVPLSINRGTFIIYKKKEDRFNNVYNIDGEPGPFCDMEDLEDTQYFDE